MLGRESTDDIRDGGTGIKNAWWFAGFNALSFQIVLGSPMILYSKSLGASATVLGIIAGMMPLMVVFQIPAARYIDRMGYKRFVLAGWSIRTLFTFGMAVVPLLACVLDAGTLLTLMLVLLFGFNLVRGISSCAWLPWITQLVPESARGRYITGETATANSGSFITIIISALCLGSSPDPWQFAVIFVFSAVTGGISLVYLNRVPDVAVTGQVRESSHPVPWMAMLRFDPFQRLLHFVVVWALAYGGLNTFTVSFLKTETGLSESSILALTSVAFLGGLCTVWLLAHRLDKAGSKPILGLSLAAWILIGSGWLLLAGGGLHAYLPVILALQLMMGFFASLVGMANSRLAMSIIPAMGRNHFFALYSVFISVALGLAPILWGLLIDLIGSTETTWLGLRWNQYSIFYLLVLVIFAAALILAGRLHEPKAASLESLLSDLMIQSPQRLWLRLWPRE